MTAGNINKIYQQERLFKQLASGVVALFVLYICLVNSVVFNLVGRQRALDDLATRQSAVVSLETEYLALSGGVTLDRAYALGFHDAAGSVIFARPLAGGVVALNTKVALP
ncbi:MAG: hypothetical protein AAB364_01535 [Patescibacteria group bacterium]